MFYDIASGTKCKIANKIAIDQVLIFFFLRIDILCSIEILYDVSNQPDCMYTKIYICKIS